ncbi:MAG: hypothetical protein IPQ08_04820 [Chitinophagaceae bacterium]|nr:hypothetical protein [Chitinophagaceae bacterium]
MNRCLFFVFMFIGFSAMGQSSRDSLMSKCPVFITDTLSNNNYFIEARPATLKVYRVKGDLTIVVEQKDQLFSLFFHCKRLSTRGTEHFTIAPGSRGNDEVESTYSFKSGDQAAYISLSKGTITSTYDKTKKVWNMKVLGWITNMAGSGVSYYRVKADLVMR